MQFDCTPEYFDPDRFTTPRIPDRHRERETEGKNEMNKKHGAVYVSGLILSSFNFTWKCFGISDLRVYYLFISFT